MHGGRHHVRANVSLRSAHRPTLIRAPSAA
jgi:hypothetical protein